MSKFPKISVITLDIPDVVVVNGQFFHCPNDFFDYVESVGFDYLPISGIARPELEYEVEDTLVNEAEVETQTSE